MPNLPDGESRCSTKKSSFDFTMRRLPSVMISRSTGTPRATKNSPWPQESFDSGLRKTVTWYLTNRAWWERIRANVYRGERLGAGVRWTDVHFAK